jgi:hypothetical protein
MKIPLLFLALVTGAMSAFANQHPRLLFDGAELDQLRARVKAEPYAAMLRAVQAQVARAPTVESPLHDDRAVDLATLYAVTGQKQHAAAAEKLVLAMIQDTTLWNNPGSKGLSRGGGALRAALAYDLCADAWPAATRESVSRKLREIADSMMKSMGAGANTQLANNWQAVRFAGAGLAYLACDEPGSADAAKNCYARLKQHLQANLGDNGWNPEGIGYTQYPWQYTGPFGIAAHRAGLGDLRLEVKKATLTFWTTYAGTVAIPGEKNFGLRADLSDDHPTWSGDGTAGLAFWYAPQEQRPALRWMYDYLCGPRGDQSWDSPARGGLYSLLYYPANIPAQTPTQLNYTDRSHGIAIFRNTFHDENDIVALVNGHSRHPPGCHGGPDTNAYRLMGLGSCWVVGSGRTSDPGGQSYLFAGPPRKPGKGAGPGLGKLEAVEFLPDGGGWAVVTGSSVGVQNYRRVFGVDYSKRSGAPAVFVSRETSDNGTLWRLNTPEFNDVKTAGNQFILTSPVGSTLVGTVLEPATVQWRTGTFERGGGAGHAGFRYRGTKYIHNKWLEFDCDKNVLVVFTLQPKGQAAPRVTGQGDVVQVGRARWKLAGDRVVAGP